MTVVCQAVYHKKQIRLLDPKETEPLKARLSEGQALEVRFSDQPESWNDKRSRLFHEICDRYASKLGLRRDLAKIELKYLSGVWRAFDDVFAPPDWPDARFFLYHGQWIYFKSVKHYTPEEWTSIIDGSLQVCVEADVDVSDILEMWVKR